MKISDILNAQPVIADLAQQKLSARLAYAVQKNLRLIEQELKDYEKARLEALTRSGGTPNQETGVYDFTPEQRAAFDAEFRELLETEVLFAPHLISMELLDRDGVKLTPVEMMQIEWLVKESEVEYAA
jgi:hypothetical protein